uniref:Protein-lysine N-methyltransferase RMAR00112_LOCUS17155 n=1 Tax=Rhodosorus marinus TaxID=101924 RepID=A0A7S3EEI3_9RHOD|mmetsp:Transcript_30152/g.115662  ORF Transcript_30152/g.115662 Transcript_30152/m.115662 type:complete len:402 (+) Transcript_30152:532-1737(+)|eukprot:CAMPEP_0113964488 /NCGR_PEP_ID=MMETSP0011_2-20120614/7175_1 /TAXON_ID=101924 /ORGANISM="Rhodosorus marinus" /LENGTH=401 /DNA_ID=CAMNT_0000976811 /DNA_START=329 /DNA_END=1534 /DNA_ORIENTATION=+ /assembly_acc=CAM_ASM_000156
MTSENIVAMIGEAKWNSLSFEEVRSKAESFSEDRDWNQFHTPRNLLLAMVGEVGELSECFQWKGEVAENLIGFSDAEKHHIAEEMSDVLVYLIRLADKCGVDLPNAVLAKMIKNEEKYPAHLARGRSTKYTELEQESASGTSRGEPERDSENQPEQADKHVSELGKREYWSSTYEKELDLFREHRTYGEDWFSRHTGRGRLRKFIEDQIINTFGEANTRLLDVGCGNGLLLMEMAESERVTFQFLQGIDYAESAIDVCLAYQRKKLLKNQEQARTVHEKATRPRIHGISFKHMDFLDNSLETKSFEVVHDKGTLDAMYLSSEENLGLYMRNLASVVADRGLFIITSCNLTKEELLGLFSPPVFPSAKLLDELSHRSFTFGGQKGSAVTTLAIELTGGLPPA